MEFECVPCCLRWLNKMSPEELKVNADLVGASGVQRGFDQRGPAQTFQLPEAGGRGPSGTKCRGHALAVARMARNRNSDFP